MRLLLLACLAASPASAQVDMGAGMGPDALLYSERKRPPAPPVHPVALAASLAFDPETWARVHVSSVPARDLSALLRRGYYKLELLQLVLLAKGAGAKLEEIAAEHDKGSTLRQIAAARKLDFDSLYEEALRIDARVVDALLPSVMAVSSSGRPLPPSPAPKRSRAPRREGR